MQYLECSQEQCSIVTADRLRQDKGVSVPCMGAYGASVNNSLKQLWSFQESNSCPLLLQWVPGKRHVCSGHGLQTSSIESTYLAGTLQIIDRTWDFNNTVVWYKFSWNQVRQHQTFENKKLHFSHIMQRIKRMILMKGGVLLPRQQVNTV